MQPRSNAVIQTLQSSRIWVYSTLSGMRPFTGRYVCRNCQHKFSTSSFSREAVKKWRYSAQDVVKPSRGSVEPAWGIKRYDERLVIYHAGDLRTSWLAFWKGTALFQFGVTCTFLAPALYKNENQPDATVRLQQALGVVALSAVPVATLAYVTAPFVKMICVKLPTFARTSTAALLRFSANMPPQTLFEFTTLRAFPFQRNTAVMLHELRSLPPQVWRFANIQRIRTPEWRKEQSQKSWWRKFLAILNEPRFKFYVKEGRRYTAKTGVPEVWENVARAIQKQTMLESGVTGKSGKGIAVQPRLVENNQVKWVKRHTARSTR